ncbi:MAG: 50S ribosomal protein L18 [Nanoarchaeota archaeon]|nr:50S ribosomal protein L18 [Nanoarchaeota archaeon]
MKKHTRTTTVPHRRRREQRTDYRARLKLLKSNKPRFVVRRGTNGIMCQIVEHQKSGDKTLVSIGPAQLTKAGYKGHRANSPAAYVTGFLCAAEVKKKKVTDVVLDIGLQSATKGSVLFAALKGAVDGGLAIPHGEQVLPSVDRVTGAHIAAFAKKLKDNEAAYKKQFGGYEKAGVKPEDLPEHVNTILKKHGKAKD